MTDESQDPRVGWRCRKCEAETFQPGTWLGPGSYAIPPITDGWTTDESAGENTISPLMFWAFCPAHPPELALPDETDD